ncbi:KGK domain-containing protein [Calothrix sp. PCC 7507]|uniref:KGK domain-containing protein n=1 Tax=Calothrix sp. PCC 7507 TaxID=99598 RepID=UPI00029EC723|nr:KGK domain-containing protein [Calothrix sp. PCC 7507]AFY34964.1 KGK family protein [Calothrix sp. PCC 7507]
MNKIFQPLECDSDVLLFNNTTYLVSQFKELIRSDFANKFHNHINSNYLVSIPEALFKIEDIIWKFDGQGINCRILRVSSTGWKPGKLRIRISTEIIPPPPSNPRVGTQIQYKIGLEFCPDEPDEPAEPESPLDDIRKMMQAT